MATTKNDRKYDIILVGATGYTGKLTAHHIARNLPTNLKWAIAGRSSTKLDALAEELKRISQDRLQPGMVSYSLLLEPRKYILMTLLRDWDCGRWGEGATDCSCREGKDLHQRGVVQWGRRERGRGLYREPDRLCWYVSRPDEKHAQGLFESWLYVVLALLHIYEAGLTNIIMQLSRRVLL